MSSPEMKSKLPPQNVEAESSLLASLMIDSHSFDEIAERRLTVKDFYDERHQNIYQAILELVKKGRPVDLITVTETLKTLQTLEKSGGVDYLSGILDKITSSANVNYYAEIIKSKSMLRQLIFATSEIVTKCFENVGDVRSLLDDAEKKIFEINQDLFTNDFTPIKEIVNKTIEELTNNENKSGLSGVPSGFVELDDKTDGFQKSELIVIAARPSMGKTSLALNIAANASIKYGKRIGIFSCEMSKYHLGRRMICSEARVNELKMKKGMLTRQEKDYIVQAAEKLYDTPIVFDDTPNIQILELRTKARKMMRDYKLDMIIIDYLGLITVGDEAGRNLPRHEQIAYVSRSLKSLARQLEIPIIALAQLNRNVESRGEDARPKLSDLKDSGSIEQDADVILFIHGKGIDSKQPGDDENRSYDVDQRELIIGKNRNGPTDIVKVVFLKSFTRFESYTKDLSDAD